jgi:RNA polymerase sigma factor (TIGR02999 family)
MSDVSQLLAAIEQGQPQAAEKLLPLVYDELRKLAAAKLAHEKPGHSLDATALVHEAYVRLAHPGKQPGTGDRESDLWNGRGHFFAAAANAMRRILIENARSKTRLKHGGDLLRVPLSDIAQPDNDEQLLALDEALTRLASEDAQAAQVVELHHFAGLSHELVAPWESRFIRPASSGTMPGRGCRQPSKFRSRFSGDFSAA